MTCDINQLVIALQEKRREILACPSDSPRLAKLRLEQERLFARLFPKIQALIHKLVQREYAKRKDFPLLVSEIDDFVQEATVAMLKAIDRFDPSRGTKYTTMMTRYVKTKINDAIRKETKFKPKGEDEDAVPVNVVSTSKPIGKTDEGDNPITINDTIDDKNSPSPGEIAERHQMAEDIWAAANKILSPERLAIFKAYVACDYSIAKLARQLNRPYSQVLYVIGAIKDALKWDLRRYDPKNPA
ncbi:MAG: sigma-70 family RNA polymerase sigma factor [Thermoguttaceae bacterium]|nr:sigma-70 family RNA polymerase sigma factor [Thermoguttaceae bacterium]MBQ6619550.1 sigma-70 family RNA polymerase sigma factor [Thermoguttaceae bacterium]